MENRRTSNFDLDRRAFHEPYLIMCAASLRNLGRVTFHNKKKGFITYNLGISERLQVCGY